MRVLVALALLLSPTGRHVVVSRPTPEMVLIPAGEFTMGMSPDSVWRLVDLCKRGAGPSQELRWCSPTYLDDGEPEVSVLLPAYEIDRYEVTNADYRVCVRAGACSAEPLGRVDERFQAPRQPVVGVTWDDAVDYCRWRGKRLPTEAEWEKAARGPAGRLWPWGNDWDDRATNHGRFEATAARGGDFAPDDDDGATYPAPVGSFPRDRSPFGVYDMAGNVSEWVDDWYGREPVQARSRVSPRGLPVAPWRSLRGGSWRSPAFTTMAPWRSGLPPDYATSTQGFRCARDARP